MSISECLSFRNFRRWFGVRYPGNPGRPGVLSWSKRCSKACLTRGPEIDALSLELPLLSHFLSEQLFERSVTHEGYHGIPVFFLHNYVLKVLIESAADVKMEIPVLVRSLKSSILSSTSFQMGKTFWGVVSAAVEQSRRKANMFAQGDGKFGP